VTFAGWSAGGWGYLVAIAHSNGVRTLYAHLSRVSVRVGQRVAAGQRVGRVGASGYATGPHLHFEVRLRGAAVDPLPALF
jgi:murein DD-endopeptidase MepM/ murein hydrolase activator NlpD